MNIMNIQDIIYKAIEMINHIREDDKQIPMLPTTELYAQDAHLDSMGLVSLLIEVEDLFLDQNIEISLSDDRAMSQTQSPFRTVDTLTAYIQELLEETTL